MRTYEDPTKPIRLNKYLANAGICSRREADDFIQAGVITVNGEVVDNLGAKVLPTDKVMFHNQPVRRERKVYILLNKPKNTVTTTDDPEERHTVLDIVRNACAERIYPVGRLDRNTTGVVLVARHALSAALLYAAMAEGSVQKSYLAVVRGRVSSTVIKSGIRRREQSVIFREVCRIGEGDYAETVVETLAANDALSLVRLTPKTGRTHQLRVHMAWIGHPLLGDELYGDGKGMSRHALHAARLTFPMPGTEQSVTVCAPLPADMAEKIAELGKEAIRLAQKESGQTGAEL
jgi:RluA family pseudouridine synthase